MEKLELNFFNFNDYHLNISQSGDQKICGPFKSSTHPPKTQSESLTLVSETSGKEHVYIFTC